MDTTGGQARGWYYGTSDDFDAAREGYLPGFFVAPMTQLALTSEAISFVVVRPERLFTAPVELRYRSAADVPAGTLEEWTVPLVLESREYTGTVRDGEITIVVDRTERVFRRAEGSR